MKVSVKSILAKGNLYPGVYTRRDECGNLNYIVIDVEGVYRGFTFSQNGIIARTSKDHPSVERVLLELSPVPYDQVYSRFEYLGDTLEINCS